MKLTADTRYTNYRQTDIAVDFNGQHFLAYAVGQEDTNVTITMEVLMGMYPEVKGEAIVRLEGVNKNGTTFGYWSLATAQSETTPPQERSWSNLQDRTRDAMQDRFGRTDLVTTLERTVDRLDKLLAATKHPSAWADVIMPILHAAKDEGVDMDDILNAGYRKVQWMETQNKKSTDS